MIHSVERKRILFFAEAATLAHVARPMVLAQSLDRRLYNVHFACHSRYRYLFSELEHDWRTLDSISPAAFLQALAQGKPLYDEEQLRSYVKEDLRLIDELKPDLIVGDFRLSLSVSARLAKVPYISITNAYWSPYARPHYQVPELPLTRALGVTMANILFRAVRRPAFALHTLPLNRVRKSYGLPSLGPNLGRIYTDADITLYADLPELIPTYERPGNHHYIGPINWSPSVSLPEWWDQVPDDRHLLYVTLGSSGQTDTLPPLLEAIGQLDVYALVAHGGRIELGPIPQNVYSAEFLPGETAASRANLVICNGGSPTAMQGLSAGVPILGLASNLDQYLNMGYLEAAGCGMLLRAGKAEPRLLSTTINTLLESPGFKDNATRIQSAVQARQAPQRFAALLQTLF